MTRSLPAAVFLCLALNGFALEPANYGSSMVSTATDGDSTIVTLQDAAGRSFVVAYLEEPSAEVMKKVVGLKDLFFAWKSITVKTLRFTITDDIVDTLIIPDKILVNGSDVQNFVPAGLLFSFSGGLAYDFRVTKDNFFLRVRGTYTSEDEMTQKIAAALANPATFLQRSDMEYVLTLVDKQGKAIEALSAEVDALRYAAMRRENTEWLFWKVPIPRDGLERVVALKRQNPALKKSEVEAQLKQEGIKISRGAIGIIFEYYFNEF